MVFIGSYNWKVQRVHSLQDGWIQDFIRTQVSIFWPYFPLHWLHSLVGLMRWALMVQGFHFIKLSNLCKESFFSSTVQLSISVPI